MFQDYELILGQEIFIISTKSSLPASAWVPSDNRYHSSIMCNSKGGKKPLPSLRFLIPLMILNVLLAQAVSGDSLEHA